MKLKVGIRFKSIEGPSKGKEFVVTYIDKYTVEYKSEESGQFYDEPRKNFEKRLERIGEYWTQTNKDYKRKKQDLKGEQ